MARRSLQLPNIRARVSSTTGKSQLKLIPREKICLKRQDEQTHGQTKMKRTKTSTDDDHDDHDELTENELINHDEHLVKTADSVPSLYSVKQKIAADSWKEIRNKLRDVCVERSALSNGQKCIHCSIIEATIWCRRCGANAYFCHQCWLICHTKINIMHIPEIWEKNCFKPLTITDRRIDALPVHSCSTKRDVVISCLNEDGVTQGIIFSTCECEAISVTLARSRLWPATPKNPRYAFSFELMDWCEALLLECQVSLKDFCEALYYKCPYLVVKHRDAYESLIDSFEEYRYMKSQLRHLSFLSNQFDDGNICPACPKKSGTVIMSMDALFGLPRKKSSGISHREHLYGNLYFTSQSEVDDFVEHYNTSKNITNECNSFLAGNPLRSSIRYTALDETALFGCACRHEIPMMFLNLKHGERLGYGVFLLTKILSYLPETINIIMMYDIACTLQQHIKNHHEILPTSFQSRLQLAIPAFHAYGHKAECQMSFSPLRCTGIGLSDGEGMERLWSYLRRFCRMTKEMRKSHRIDILTSCLSYWSHKKKQKLYESLLKRLRKAQTVKDEASKKLQEIIEFYDLNDDEITNIVGKTKEMTPTVEIATTKNDLQQHLIAQKKELKNQTRLAVERRFFLLRQKAKYADGQKIANKLSKQITKVTTTIKDLIKSYNEIQTDDPVLQLCEVLNPNSKYWSSPDVLCCSIPIEDKHMLIQVFYEVKRADEELILLEEEMLSVKTYYEDNIALIDSVMNTIQAEQDNAYNKGSLALLIKLRWTFEIQLQKCAERNSYDFEQNSDSSSDSDSDDNNSDS